MRIAVAVAMIALVLVGCGGDATPSHTSSPSPLVSAEPIATSRTSATSGPTTPASATAAVQVTATPSNVPPAPTGVRITRNGCYTGPDGAGISGVCTTTITWKPDLPPGTEIEVYGVTECLSLEQSPGSGSCLEPDGRVSPDLRKLIAHVPAGQGTVSWTGPAWLDDVRVHTGPPRYETLGVDRHGDDLYFAILVTAHNPAGRSAFVVADAGTWCYETGCAGP